MSIYKGSRPLIVLDSPSFGAVYKNNDRINLTHTIKSLRAIGKINTFVYVINSEIPLPNEKALKDLQFYADNLDK